MGDESEAISCAILGADHPGMRIRAEVSEGDAVGVGQVLFRDRKRPAIAFVSPIAGRVEAIRLGARRILSEVAIAPGAGGPPAEGTTGDLRATLLARGLWPAFVARPFGGCPDPGAVPEAIVVVALPGSPAAPDPQTVLEGRGSDLARGLAALSELADGPVHLCVQRGSTLGRGLPGVRRHDSRGPATAGALVARVAPGRAVWTIGVQDVAAIGHLLKTGAYDPVRTVAVDRTLRRVPLGAALDGLLPGAARPVSGPTDHGRPAAFLGRHHLEAHAGAPVAPRRGGAIVPLGGLDRVLPAGIPAVPLMRALAVGDVARCDRLGCRALLEEDVTPLTLRCTSGTDYGVRLRAALDAIRAEAA